MRRLSGSSGPRTGPQQDHPPSVSASERHLRSRLVPSPPVHTPRQRGHFRLSLWPPAVPPLAMHRYPPREVPSRPLRPRVRCCRTPRSPERSPHWASVPAASLRFEVFASWLAVLFALQRPDVARTRQPQPVKNRKEKAMRTFFRRACVTTLVATGAGLMGFFIASAVPGVSDATLASSTSHGQVGCYGTAPSTGSGTTASSTTSASGSTGSTGSTGATGSDRTRQHNRDGTLINVAAPVAASPGASQSGTGSLINVAAPVSSTGTASQPGAGTGTPTGTGTGTGTLVNVAAPVAVVARRHPVGDGIVDQRGGAVSPRRRVPLRTSRRRVQDTGTPTRDRDRHGDVGQRGRSRCRRPPAQANRVAGTLVNLATPVSSPTGSGLQ